MIEDAILRYIFEREYRLRERNRMHWNRWISFLRNEVIVLDAADHDLEIR